MDDTKTRWYEGDYSAEHLAKLRKILDLDTKEEINAVLQVYVKTLELMINDFPGMSVETQVEWAVANACSPDWFGDALTTRIQNSMLVSALLLTVTASSFMSPIGEQAEAAYRVSCYLNGICSGCFLANIFLGVMFVENAMSRAYTFHDRFNLIVQLYFVMNLAQIMGTFGTLLFPVCLLVPLKIVYIQTDAVAMYIIFGVTVLMAVYLSYRCINKAAAKQTQRSKAFLPLTIPSTGRLRPQYQPMPMEDGENYQELCEKKYRRDGIEFKGSICDCITKLAVPHKG